MHGGGQNMKEINLKPIGYVKNSEKEPRFGSFANEITEVVVDEKFTDGLNSVEDYSHVIIIFWMVKSKNL